MAFLSAYFLGRGGGNHMTFDEGAYREHVGDTKARIEGIEKRLDEHKRDIDEGLSGIRAELRIEMSNIRMRLESMPKNGMMTTVRQSGIGAGAGVSVWILLEQIAKAIGGGG